VHATIKELPRTEWAVCIREHHDGYITWDDVRGAFRTTPVWIADADGRKLNDVSPPETIVAQLKGALSWWRETYRDLAANPLQGAVVGALAEFHIRLARIHPFIDGNGRVIRFILDQASEELLNRRIDRKLTQDERLYYEALAAAADGDLDKLRLLISAAVL
jgi:Fic family protein